MVHHLSFNQSNLVKKTNRREVQKDERAPARVSSGRVRQVRAPMLLRLARDPARQVLLLRAPPQRMSTNKIGPTKKKINTNSVDYLKSRSPAARTCGTSTCWWRICTSKMPEARPSRPSTWCVGLVYNTLKKISFLDLNSSVHRCRGGLASGPTIPKDVALPQPVGLAAHPSNTLSYAVRDRRNH